jgi:anti-sigma B factor antagonist
MAEEIHLIRVHGIIGKSEYVSYDLDTNGVRTELTRYHFDPQAIPTDLNDIIEEGFIRGRNHVILDMGNIPWINSKGLGTLVMLFQAVKKRGGALVLARPTPDVLEMIESTGGNQVFEIFGSVHEAWGYLQALSVSEMD